MVLNDDDFIMDPCYRDLAMFITNDCGLNIRSDELALVYSLVTSSCMNMMVGDGEFPGLFMTGALLKQSTTSLIAD